MTNQLRHRKSDTSDPNSEVMSENITSSPEKSSLLQQDDDNKYQKIQKSSTSKSFFSSPHVETFYLTRRLLVRSIAVIYAIAFLVAHNQNSYLIGKNGLLPGDAYLKKLGSNLPKSSLDKFFQVPSLFWFTDLEHFDFYLNFFQIVGLAISSFILLTGKSNGFLFSILWIFYHTIISVGQNWYSFGWESQTLETGFLAIFLVPFFQLQSPKNEQKYPPSRFIIWLYRWIIFRIMIGAGMIKIRGDACWRDLTCMFWFHETQPIPNPLAYFMHFSPRIFLKFETLVNHIVELGVPWLMLLPFKSVVRLAGVLQIGFMFGIYVSGNLSFLNVLTMVPSIACLDDDFLAKWLRMKTSSQVDPIDRDVSRFQKIETYLYSRSRSSWRQKILDVGLFSLIAYLSSPVVMNLLSSRQMMNTSFDTFKIVNTYGAFGSVTKERYEIIIEGTTSDQLNGTEVWQPYEFKCKPGKIDAIPCQIAPYHYRLDWLMWFAAFNNQSWRHHTWFLSLALKMLRNDQILLKNLLHDIPQGDIQFIRAKRYLYHFGEENWYDRKIADWEDFYLPPMSLEDLENFLRQYSMFDSWLKSEKF